MKRNRKKWIKRVIVPGVIIIAVVAYISLSGGKGAGYDTEVAKTRDIETFYTFSGNIEPDDAKTLYAATAGKINKIYKLEGDSVEKDENVMRFQAGTTFEAPITGTVSDIYVELNDTVQPGDPLMRVAAYHQPVVIISIDEYDIGSVHVGDAVTVHIQAANQTVAGIIEKIDKEATITANVAYYKAKVAIEQDGTILMGMTCEVSVPKDSVKSATTISLNALRFDEDNRPYVFMHDRYDEVVAEYVTLGVNNGAYVEVREGIKSGETVLIPQTQSRFMSFSALRDQ